MVKTNAVRQDELWATLPPLWPERELLARIRQATLASRRKVVVLDDDPTGTQTVHDVPVLTEWQPVALAAGWDQAGTTFYVLTNSRRYPLEEAVAMNREIGHHLAQVARERGVEPVVISRSDSTLRGHYPGEVLALVETLETELRLRYDGVVIVPFFLEGGRFTAQDVHWVLEGEQLTPAAQTEFAQDPTFGYRHSNLRQWVVEKSRGHVSAERVMSISLEDIRKGGPKAVAARLLEATNRRVIIVNAVSYRDLDVFVWGMMQAEKQGKRFLFRAAASFVKVRGGIPDRGLLTIEELQPDGVSHEIGGLSIVGSFVQRTTQQLGRALELKGTLAVELNVSQVLAPDVRQEEVARVQRRVQAGLRDGQDVILFTSRALIVPDGMSQLQVAQQVSGALSDVLRQLALRPAYLIGKGGITSSDLATDALGVRSARVLGQLLPGVPVWRLGAESRYPGLSYVVFPGNVGGADAVAQAIRILRGQETFTV
jgi:uncharacterized protein YgbK (DUF1537 family)